jgi:succinoglycan biosynthesis protein ExoA
MTDSVEVSLISACRNEARCIREFLDSILAQEMVTRSWEILIADGASNDGTRQVIEEYAARCPRVRLIDNPARIVSTGLNAAIRAARGRYILRVDAHTTYAADYSAQCIAALERTGADNAGGAARTTASGPKARAIAAAYRSKFSTGGASFHDPGHTGWVDTVPYGCWRRELFDRIGYFDDELVRNQDDEFNLRIIRSGGRIWQDRAIHSWYSPRPDYRSLFHQYFQYGFWKVFVIRKHRLPASLRHLIPAAFVLSMLLLPLAGLAAYAISPNAGLWLPEVAAVLWCLYLSAVTAASFAAARQNGWDLLAWLPLAFAAYHFSYGSGFLAGLVNIVRQSSPGTQANSVYSKLTR